MTTKSNIQENITAAEIFSNEMVLINEARGKQDTPEDTALAMYTDGVPYDENRVVDEIRFYMNQTVQGIIETGKRLIVLKEKAGHGRFIELVEDKIGISRYTAWRFMTITKKLANVSRVQHLKILDLKQGIGKLYAFLDIPDDELKEFEESGELRGLTIDEIEALPVKELKERLRTRNRQIEQGTLQLTTAEKKIDSLEEEIRNLKHPKPSEREGIFLKEMENLRVSFDGYLLRVDPDRMSLVIGDDKATPRQIAAYLTTLDYMRKQALAAYAAATEKYGNPVISPEEAWHPGMKLPDDFVPEAGK